MKQKACRLVISRITIHRLLLLSNSRLVVTYNSLEVENFSLLFVGDGTKGKGFFTLFTDALDQCMPFDMDLS